MKLSPYTKLLAILLLAMVALFISLPRNIPLKVDFAGIEIDRNLVRRDIDFSYGRVNIQKELDLKLGLDLAGGSRLVFEADTAGLDSDRRETAVAGLKDVMERRVNLFGVSEPNVQTSSFEGKDRIIIELPGLSDTAQAIELIGQTAQLVFAEVGDEVEPGLYPTELTGAYLRGAQVVFDPNTGAPVVTLNFTNEGADLFAEITGRNVGKPVPIILDGEVISAPVVQSQIFGSEAQITGEFSVDDAKNLSIQLNAGALPVPVVLVEQRTVGATLGQESIEKSVKAGIVGTAMVLLFMVLAYGRLGLIADVALIIFAVLTISLYKLIPVVLTLPGIAGFMLSVGMAVDSNVLIFERFKEERRKRNLSDALEMSFERAWYSIRDANIATLTAAFVLANPLDWGFLHTSGPVRGFAITLALGVLVSLFTGIVVTRNLMRVFIAK